MCVMEISYIFPTYPNIDRIHIYHFKGTEREAKELKSTTLSLHTYWLSQEYTQFTEHQERWLNYDYVWRLHNVLHYFSSLFSIFLHSVNFLFGIKKNKHLTFQLTIYYSPDILINVSPLFDYYIFLTGLKGQETNTKGLFVTHTRKLLRTNNVIIV